MHVNILRATILAAAIGLAFPVVAQVPAPNPNSYLVLPNLAAAKARSAQQCTILKCQPGTTYWWNVIALTDGTAAIEIQPNGPFSASTANVHATAGLNTAERAALKPAATITPLMPPRP